MTAIVQQAKADIQYAVRELPTLGSDRVEAMAMNASGQIVGFFIAATGFGHAFLYSNGVMSDLGTLGGRNSVAYGINDAGVVVGEAQIVGGGAAHTWPIHAFIYTNGVMTEVNIMNAPYSVFYDINANGTAAGCYGPNGAYPRACTYSGGLATDLGTLGGSYADATAINDSGQVAGDAVTASGVWHASLYSGGLMTDLGVLSGYDYSQVVNINNSGLCVGLSYQSGAGGGTRACAFWQGTVTNLGSLGGPSSGAESINDGGQIVGYADTSPGTYRACRFVDGGALDLNSVVEPIPGWTLTMAIEVNVQGQIVCWATNGLGSKHSFLLTPVQLVSITNHPISQVLAVGAGATFTVAAGGFPAPTYQWRFNGTNIVGATNATFAIAVTSLTNAGFYDVVVANTGGSTVSSPASLTFLELKLFAGLLISGPIGGQYRVDCTPALGVTNWTTLTNLTLTSQPHYFIDYQSPEYGKRFYRAVPLP